MATRPRKSRITAGHGTCPHPAIDPARILPGRMGDRPGRMGWAGWILPSETAAPELAGTAVAPPQNRYAAYRSIADTNSGTEYAMRF